MSEEPPLQPLRAEQGMPCAPELSKGPASRVPGLAVSLAVAAMATVIGKLAPVVGGAVSGIVIGAVLATVIKHGDRLRPGITTASKTVLQVSVVMLGTQLSLRQIVQVGSQSLPVLVGTLAVCLSAAFLFGHWLRVSGGLTTLIGVGTSICGASAIAAVTPVIGVGGAEVAYAVSTIFIFNIAAVLFFPLVGHLLGLSQHAFGLFAGTAVNDMSSVVAAATTYGDAAGDYAVVVKLTRTLLIIPVCLILAALVRRRARRRSTEANDTKRVRVRALVPWFLVGFLLMAAVNTVGLIPSGAHPILSEVSVFLITMALSAIGLSTDLSGLRRTGPRPILLGGFLWIVMSGTSLVLQFLTGLL
ncbi:YeiH family protein [Streptomyces sp. NPDC002577]